jgi:cytochrome c-type biogenesis protein CcmH
MIAKDLRREVHRLLLEGKTDGEILDFMQQRYGDFILYKPRVTLGSMVLWFGPLLIFVVALYVVVRIAKGRPEPAKELDAEEEARLKKLLSNK